MLQVPHPDAPQGVSCVVSCRGCGLRRLDPRPDASSIGDYYAAATDYNAFVGRRRSPRAQRIWNFLRDGFSNPNSIGTFSRILRPITGPIARWLFDINVPLDGRTGLRVLEVGSGYGDILLYLKQRGCSVLGSDLSTAAAAKARDYGVEVRIGHLLDLRLPATSFDVAIMCHSLEHVPDPNVELAELARLLRAGGTLHIALPNGNAVRLQTEGREWLHLSHPFHFWFFDSKTIVRILEKHGFRPIEPPRTTSRHHAWGTWRHEVRTRGWSVATQRLMKYLKGSARVPDGGDVLRVMARRI